MKYVIRDDPHIEKKGMMVCKQIEMMRNWSYESIIFLLAPSKSSSSMLLCVCCLSLGLFLLSRCTTYGLWLSDCYLWKLTREPYLSSCIQRSVCQVLRLCVLLIFSCWLALGILGLSLLHRCSFGCAITTSDSLDVAFPCFISNYS